MLSHSVDQTPNTATGRPSRRSRITASAVAGTVGAAAVVTTAIAPPASASTTYRVWDRVANCESSGRWHISTGNGYYGGLQFSSSTWRAYGGARYAWQASGASRVEQIEVARRVLASQGPNAWPVCGPRAGLTRQNGGATSAALPRVAGTHKSAPSTHHHHYVGKHRATHSSTHHTYRVRSGDTLSLIASRHHVAGGWRALYRANRAHVHNPNLIRVGQVLRLP